jgi:hypothetical protein
MTRAQKPSDAELLERQAALQAEADIVLADMGIVRLLEPIGDVVRVGSSVLGLMVSRDIDLHVYCAAMDKVGVFEALRPLTVHPRVQRLRLSDWTGRFRISELPEGYSWGLRYYTDAGNVWKVDVWFFSRQDPRPAIEYDEAVRRRLTPETTTAILRIKQACHGHPQYRGVGVYSAVLDRGVRTPDGFRTYLAERDGHR